MQPAKLELESPVGSAMLLCTASLPAHFVSAADMSLHLLLQCRHKYTLFQIHGCLRFDKSGCLPETSPYFTVSHYGLDGMVHRLSQECELMSYDSVTELLPNSTRCAVQPQSHVTVVYPAGQQERWCDSRATKAVHTLDIIHPQQSCLLPVKHPPPHPHPACTHAQSFYQ